MYTTMAFTRGYTIIGKIMLNVVKDKIYERKLKSIFHIKGQNERK
jgi:hypothetical protein